MLVLTRKSGEYVQIGEGKEAVIVRVVGNANGVMKLQIEAPREVMVLRGELIERPTT